MAAHDGIFNKLIAKIGGYIKVADYLRYVPSRAYLDIASQDADTIPNKAYVDAVAGTGGQNEVAINANPFVYNTGITTYIPRFRVFLKPSSTVYQAWPAGEQFDKSNGNITVSVDYATDSYVLVIG